MTVATVASSNVPVTKHTTVYGSSIPLLGTFYLLYTKMGCNFFHHIQLLMFINTFHLYSSGPPPPAHTLGYQKFGFTGTSRTNLHNFRFGHFTALGKYAMTNLYACY